ncbi:MAG: rod shape-determining protein RodA [Melioribacteraceae bacterium]|nr:rod shape-determining protein RodA [Melioribacteraceae bacterium]MCF8355534.1 rod shape-determining protein RodA [Melioribacteraceae bacterium]MCF8394511.1 rod shape-determining protein RodA [Melioribacteraceae bacterium]MCF8420127.1 rod shape-determining protein RodA [Melioribacteraceae bacterium]
MKIGYKIQDKFDFGIFLPLILLMIIGLLVIYSATVNHPTASGNFNKQLVSAVISIVAFLVIYSIPEKTFRISAFPAYLISLLLLIVVLVVGKTVYGAKSWLSLGPLGLQPSEFAKIGLILFLAHWVSRDDRDINNIKDIGVALMIGFLPILLILLEPDLGTAIVFAAITLTMIFWGGINLFSLFIVLSPGIVTFASLFGLPVLIIALVGILVILMFFKRNLFTSATVFVVNIASVFFFDYGVKLLQPHQQKRIEAFLNPLADPLGSGYNALQAKVAIGSGGLFGKGFLSGNQTQLRFIPEQWTDFIYCVIGEEFGFFGSVITLSLFLIIFIRLLNLSTITKDKFSSLIIIGILTLLFTHFAINIGMNVGITPVIGLPLPFLSYGGSSLMVNTILLGITMNIYKHRKLHT